MSPAAPPQFWRGGLLVLLFVFGAAGCRVDAGVTISVEGRGGQVAVRFEADEEAVSVLGVPEVVSEGAQVRDLRRAGWEVLGPRRTDQGGVVLQATKPFSSPGELAGVVEELAGGEGPLSGFGLDRRRGLFRTSYELGGRIDLTTPGEALTGFGNDPDLARRLEAAGVDPERVAGLLAERARDGFRLAVAVDLPGEAPVRFEGRSGEVVDVRATSRRTNLVRPLLLVVAAAMAVAAVSVLRR